jgi:hypothetical protein
MKGFLDQFIKYVQESTEVEVLDEGDGIYTFTYGDASASFNVKGFNDLYTIRRILRSDPFECYFS